MGGGRKMRREIRREMRRDGGAGAGGWIVSADSRRVFLRNTVVGNHIFNFNFNLKLRHLGLQLASTGG